MTEALYKLIILLLLSLSFSDNENFYSYDFVNIDILPLEISKNNIGIRVSEVSDENRTFFQTQNWIAENLYFQGSFSPSLRENINVIYNLNIGYDKKVNSKFLKSTIFDFGYYYKRLETESDDEYKWTTFSIIFNSTFKNKNIIAGFIYMYNNSASNKLSEIAATVDLLGKINKNLLFKYGFKIYKEEELKVSPFISLKYKI